MESTDSAKFYLMSMGRSENAEHEVWHHFVRVRLAYFAIVMKTVVDMEREPLIRFYIGAYSQNDPSAEIMFGDRMKPDSEEPFFVDLSAEYAHTLSMSYLMNESDLREQNIRWECDLDNSFTSRQSFFACSIRRCGLRNAGLIVFIGVEDLDCCHRYEAAPLTKISIPSKQCDRDAAFRPESTVCSSCGSRSTSLQM
jgi:hypothetical protein